MENQLRKVGIEKLTEDEYNAISGASYKLGEVVYAETIAPRLFAKAGEYFAIGKDDQARLLRDLAKEFKEQAENMRTDYKKNYRD